MVAMWAIALGIVVVQRDLGAALLFFGVFLALVYVATGRVSLVVIGLILFVLGSLFMALLFDHVRIRIAIWLDPFADPLGAGYQVVQALHAFARGGLVGVGLGAGLPQIDGGPPIPEIHTDFPLAALGEELGVVGVVAILGLYLVVIERGLRIGAAAADDFRSLLAVGLSLVIGIQAFIIAAGNLKVLPLTGVTLPFISYGGSSLLANGVVDRPAPRAVRQGRRTAAASGEPASLAGAAWSRGVALMRTSGATRRPLGRPIVHVARRALARVRRRSPAPPATGASCRPRADPLAERRGGHRRVPDRAARPDPRSRRHVPGPEQERCERRALPGLREPAISPVVGYASPRYGRAGLERTYDAELAGLSGDPLRDAFRKFGARPVRPART